MGYYTELIDLHLELYGSEYPADENKLVVPYPLNYGIHWEVEDINSDWYEFLLKDSFVPKGFVETYYRGYLITLVLIGKTVHFDRMTPLEMMRRELAMSFKGAL